MHAEVGTLPLSPWMNWESWLALPQGRLFSDGRGHAGQWTCIREISATSLTPTSGAGLVLWA